MSNELKYKAAVEKSLQSITRGYYRFKGRNAKSMRYLTILCLMTLLTFILEPKLTELLSYLTELLSYLTKLLLDLNQIFIKGLNPNVLGGLLVICSFLLLVSSILLKTERYVSSRWTLLSLIPPLLYSYYRWYSSAFEFYYLCKSVAYMDIVFFCYLVGVGVEFYCLWYARSKQGQSLASSYIQDDNAIDSRIDDLLGITPLADRLLDDLDGVDLSRHSFSVGVNAPWGKGKTSFLNLLEERLNLFKCDKSIVIKFNPRNSKSSGSIQEDFFKAFSRGLAPYHFGFDFLVNRYIRLLGLLADNFIQQGFSQVVNFFSPIEDKDQINKAIDAIGKRIYIFIDDLDRLTGDELLEVFKIIGGNADFHHTIFVTAYDKLYVNEVLSQYLVSKPNQAYTDKYFAMEFTLPEQSIDDLTYWASRYLEERIDGNQFVGKEEVLEAWRGVSDKIVAHLGNLRHIKRYINLFLSRYLKVMADVNCRDFMLLTLLRYKDPVVYNALSRKYFLEQGGWSFGSFLSFYLHDDEEFKEKIKRVSTWEHSLDLLYELFPVSNTPDTSSSEIEEVYRRIRFVDSFHLYFVDYLPNIAYQKDLHPLLEGSDAEAISRLEELCRNNQSGRVDTFIYIERKSGIRTKEQLYRIVLLSVYKYASTSNLKFGFRWIYDASYINKYLDQGIVPSIEEYKKFVNSLMQRAISEFSQVNNVCELLLSLLDIGSENNFKEVIYSKEELLEKILQCQQEYYKGSAEVGFNLDLAWMMAIFYNDKLGDYQEKRLASLFALMQERPDEFARNLIADMTYLSERTYLGLKMNMDWIFPINGVTFNDWLEKISDEQVHFICHILYQQGDPKNKHRIIFPIDAKYKEGDTDYIYSKLKELYPQYGDFL